MKLILILILFWAIFLFIANNSLFSQEINEFNNLDKYNTIAGPNFGYGGTESEQWKLYKEISLKYSSENIEKEYFKTNSIITKIYLYWILRERNWNNISVIYNDLLKYSEIEINFAPGGCIVLIGYPIKDVINYNYSNYYDKN
jgi:hypothetical protein